jgi:methylthioribulose-1-phosphate dehydratase
MQRNPFPVPTPLESVLLEELVRAARLCYERGWSYGTAGNFSLRGTDGLIWQSPSGLNKGELDRRLFIPVDLETGKTAMPEAARPSLEMPVHLGVYRSVPAARAVVHTHPPFLVRASRDGQALFFQGDEMQKALGASDHLQSLRIPVLRNPTPAEMPALAASLGGQLVPQVPLVVLAGHGVYAWGRTPIEALIHVEAVEFLCKTQSRQP